MSKYLLRKEQRKLKEGKEEGKGDYSKRIDETFSELKRHKSSEHIKSKHSHPYAYIEIIKL